MNGARRRGWIAHLETVARVQRRRRRAERLELCADLLFWAWLVGALGWLAWHALGAPAMFAGFP